MSLTLYSGIAETAPTLQISCSDPLQRYLLWFNSGS